MYPKFFVNLGPKKLSSFKLLFDFETSGLSDETQFENFISLNNKYKSNRSLSFVYENYDFQTDISEVTLVVSKNDENKFTKHKKLIKVNNVHETVAILSNQFYRDFNNTEENLLPEPSIGDNCEISEKANIKKGCVIGSNSIIKDGVIIDNNCIIGDNSLIEENSIISNSILGDNIRVGRNSSIGQIGFGFAIHETNNKKIFHIGRVILQSNVNIGSNCCIDRGSFDDTIIGENTYLDNMCHVAHNVRIGRNCIFAAMCGIAGSTIIGDNVMAGGQTGISGHITIGSNVLISAKSAVFKDLKNNSSVMGNPAIDKFKYIRKYKKIYE